MHEDGWARVLGRYAERVHAIVGDGHHVASPLGAWILVALSSPVAVGAARGELAEALGADPAAAAEFAARLVVHPHPVVGCGAAVWNRPGFDTERISAWRDALPGAVETGDIPTQALLDGWAERHTLGLISRFPIEVTLEVVLLMATALATKVSWARPFDLAPGTALGPSSPWSSRLERVLHAPTGDPRHRQFIADTSRAGTVAVHLAEARGGLLVASVIAAPGVAAVDVLRSAHEIAASEAIRPGSVQRRSLFELPLGEGSLWNLTEDEGPTTAPGSREERCEAVLPAWSAASMHDLDDEALGFPAAAFALKEALELDDYGYEARQAAVARYSAVGFEAAAVSALAVKLSARVERSGRRRTAVLRFGHPFAAVAVAIDSLPGSPGDPTHTDWHGLPVFSAWISEPAEPDAESSS